MQYLVPLLGSGTRYHNSLPFPLCTSHTLTPMESQNSDKYSRLDHSLIPPLAASINITASALLCIPQSCHLLLLVLVAMTRENIPFS